jgi:hypothetical protein
VLCGSTYLNKRSRSTLEKKLQGTENLEDVEAKINLAVIMFDENCKPTFVVLNHSKFFAFPITLRRDSETVASGSRRQLQQSHLQVLLLIACKKDLCEQVFDEIIDTIVMKVQRQIAKDHDEELDLHIEVRAALATSRYRC